MIRTALSQALTQCTAILNELEKLPRSLADSLFIEANVGRHMRHVLDHVLALKEACTTELVDYDKRHRGNAVETDRLLASQQFSVLNLWLQTEDLDDRALIVASEIDGEKSHRMRFESNLNREILYIINHTIHHAAHIKLALSNFGIALPDHIGIAPGTASFNRSLRSNAESQCAH